MEFLSKYPDTRFNITIDTSEYEFDYTKLRILNTIHKHIYIVTSLQEEKYKQLKEMGLKFYFSPDFPIVNFRLLEYIINLGVTDVYIMDDLCYNLERVRKMADKYNVHLRLILNHIPSMLINKGEDVRAPIFIPETVDELSKYIHTVEFDDGNSWARLETLYKVWFIKKEWRENLRFINADLNIDIPNQCMMPNFTVYKMNCGYKCGYGSVCKKCNQFYELAKDLESKKIEYIISKEEEGE